MGKLSIENLKAEAEIIDRLINSGALLEKELPLLVREGLSQETVDYYMAWKVKSKLIDNF